jgi:hypothetical protein
MRTPDESQNVVALRSAITCRTSGRKAASSTASSRLELAISIPAGIVMTA